MTAATGTLATCPCCGVEADFREAYKARCAALTAERDELRAFHAAIADAMGMVHEPETGPSAPAIFTQLVDGAKEQRAALTEGSEREGRLRMVLAAEECLRDDAVALLRRRFTAFMSYAANQKLDDDTRQFLARLAPPAETKPTACGKKIPWGHNDAAFCALPQGHGGDCWDGPQ